MNKRDKYFQIIDKFREFRKAEMTYMQKMKSLMDVRNDEGHLLMFINKDIRNQKKLAEIMHISEPTMSVRLKRLETNGYIERHPSKEDKRQTEVILTELGKKRADEFHQACIQYFYKMMEDFSDEELSQLIHILDKFIDKLDGEIKK